MPYPKRFLELQIIFARKIASLKNIALDEALLKYTNLYRIFRIQNWNFASDNPVWKSYVLGLINSDIEEYTYQFYIMRSTELDEGKEHDSIFGCFSYHYDQNEKAVNIHFDNRDDPEPGALSKERIPLRLAELKSMFSDIQSKYGNELRVYGHSWLYNLEAYKRLFPPEYTSQLTVDPNCFRGFGQWAQFLNSQVEVKEDMAISFLEKVENLNPESDIEECFHFRVLHGFADIKYFYELYEINNELQIH